MEGWMPCFSHKTKNENKTTATKYEHQRKKKEQTPTGEEKKGKIQGDGPKFQYRLKSYFGSQISQSLNK